MKREFVCVFACLLLVMSCRQREEPLPPPPDTDEAVELVDPETLMMDAEMRAHYGDLDGAIGMLDRALADERHGDAREMFFSHLLYLLIEENRGAEACARFTQMLETDKDLAQSGIHHIHSYYYDMDDPNELIEWTGSLIQLDLPDEMAKNALTWHIQALQKQKRLDDILVLIPTCLETFEETANHRLFSRFAHKLISQGHYSDADALLSAIYDASAGKQLLRDFVMSARVHLLLAQERWAEGEEQFMRAAELLPDASLARCLRIAAPVAANAGQWDLLERLSKSILQNQRDKQRAVREAASRFMAVGRQTGSRAEITRRLNTLLQEEVPGDLLLTFFRSHSYDIVQDWDEDKALDVLRFGERLSSTMSEGKSKRSVDLLLFDFYFLVNDYDSALGVLEDRLFDHDESWYDMALNKIKAHIAERDGRGREAVERFRKFMEYVKTWESAEHDLTTGISYTREMSLGFNAARIGNILASIGDEEGAAEAYGEARAYYEQALMETDPDQEEYAFIENALAELKQPEPEPENELE